MGPLEIKLLSTIDATGSFVCIVLLSNRLDRHPHQAMAFSCRCSWWTFENIL